MCTLLLSCVPPREWPSATTSKPTMLAGEVRSLKEMSGECGKSGDSLCSPTSTTSGTAWRRAASATTWDPTGAITPPLASTALAPMITLLTRAIIAKMAESVMAVVLMPLLASSVAMVWPSFWGVPSATTTWKERFLDASWKNLSAVCEKFMVRMTSLAWMCSWPCMLIWVSMRSSSSISSFRVSITLVLLFHCGDRLLFFFPRPPSPPNSLM
mmetsp:Transcript_38690/g.98945  ORF Transcript_38690/g.98945 Transcript_38690/m.98945 type:complete len:213 (+) Transcript_38690:289-927(+)